MKRIFASSTWTRVIWVLAAIFIVWSLTLIISVKLQQTELAREAGVISKLNGMAQSIFALEQSLEPAGPDSSWRWRTLYSDYRTRRQEFDPGDPNFRDLQVNLIRTDSLLIRISRLQTDWWRAGADPLWQKTLQADFYREINLATAEVQNAVLTMRERAGKISEDMAGNWNALFVLVLAVCGLALAVTWLLRLLQQDLAKIEEADKALRASEERFRQTFEQAPNGMATMTPAGKFIQVNPAFCRLLGYSEAELLQRNIADVSHAEDWAAHRDGLHRLQRGEISNFQLEKRYWTQKRQTIYTLLQANVVREAGGAVSHFIEQVIDITERRHAELARQQSEERFRELAENSAEVFWLTDPAKNEVFYVNPVYEKIWGRSRQSLYETPHTWMDAIHPDDRERVRKAALTKQVIGQYDETFRILRSDGAMRWVRDRAFPIRDEQGSVHRVAGIAEDITERKQVELARHEVEERWSFAIEGSDAGVWDWEVQTNKVFYSRRWKEMLGYQEYEIGDSLDESYSRIHPEDLPATVAALEKHLRGETPLYISEHRERCRDGSYKWFQDRAKVMTRSADGKPLRVVGTHTDINEQAQAKTEKMRKSEEQFRLTFEMAPVGMTISGVDGVLLQCNRAFCEMLGYTAEELQGKTWIEVTHPNDVSTNIAFRERLLRSDIPNFQMQKRYLAKNGQVVHAQLQMTLIQDERGRPVHFISQTLNLTALKETQGELTRQSAILQSIVDSMADGVVVADTGGKFLVFNPAAENIIGVGALESSPPDWAEKYGLYLPDQITHFPVEQNPMARAMHGETVPAVEMFVRNPQRPRGVWLSVTGAPLRDAEEKLLGGVVVFRDVTAQKHAEEALRKNEEQFRLTFEHAPIGMAISSIDGAILQVNQAYCDILGRTPDELVNRSVMEFTHPEDSTENLDLTRQLLRGEIPRYQMGKRYLAKDGHVVYAILTASVVRDHDGHPLHFIGQIADITKRQQAEEEVRKLNAGLEQRVIARTKELQESEARFRMLIETMNDGLVQLDEKGLLVYVNDKMCEMTGFSREQLLGREVLPHLDTESRDILREQIERRQTGESKPYEMEIRKQDGKLPVLISPRPIFGLDGSFNGSFAVVTDISERQRLEEQIRRHAEELEQLVEERAKRICLLEQQRAESEKLAATGRMSARIAHEINNPLAGIKNSFLLVKDGIPTTHRYYDYVRRIETEIERIARIVRQMFDLYRPQQDSVRSFPADIAIGDVVALLRTNCRERDITIDVDINAPALNVALSESSLRQVLYNVIQNAVEASTPGSTVRVCAVAERQKLIVNVIDQGQGIPEEIRTKIFEPFFTTKSGLERSGLGLGLSVSKGLVEAMGGELDFKSSVSQGSTFEIVLPLDGGANQWAAAPEAAKIVETS